LLAQFSLDGTKQVRFVSGFESVIAARSKSLPNPVSIRDYFTNYCDLHRPLSIGTVKKLSTLCSDQNAQTIEQLSRDEFLFKTVPQVFRMLPSLKVSFNYFLVLLFYNKCFFVFEKNMKLEQLLSILPAQKPVYYSIASSSVVSPNLVRLVVGKNLFSSPSNRNEVFEGLCSSFLVDRLQLGDKIEAHVQTSSFRLPLGNFCFVFVLFLCFCKNLNNRLDDSGDYGWCFEWHCAVSRVYGGASESRSNEQYTLFRMHEQKRRFRVFRRAFELGKEQFFEFEFGVFARSSRSRVCAAFDAESS
jgi:hypothetical protein